MLDQYIDFKNYLYNNHLNFMSYMGYQNNDFFSTFLENKNTDTSTNTGESLNRCLKGPPVVSS